MESDIFNKDIKVFLCRKEVLEQNTIRIYHLIWGQCSLALQYKLVSIGGIKNLGDAYGRVWIFEKVNLILSGIYKSYNIYHNTYVSVKTIYPTRNILYKPVGAYFKRFESAQTTE